MLYTPPWHDLIASTWRREFTQGPVQQLWYDGWEFAVDMHAAESAGEVFVFHYPEHDTAFIIQPLTAYVGSVHVFSRGGILGIATSFKTLLGAYSASTRLSRLEVRTRYISLARVAQACGCRFEGVTRGSFRNRHGKMVDEYILGHVND